MNLAPPQTTSGRPPLRRPRQGRIVAGVCAGVADHLGIDVVVVRVLSVLLIILTSGLAVFVYLGALLFIPSAPSDDLGPAPSAVQDGSGRDPLFWLGVGLLVVGASWAITGPVLGSTVTAGARQLVVPLVLVGFGLALWRAGDRPRPPASSPVAPHPVWDPPPPPAPAHPPNTAGASSPSASSTGRRPTSEQTMPPAPVIESDPDAPDGATAPRMPGSPSSPGAEPPPGSGAWWQASGPPPVRPPGNGGGGGGHWTPPPVPTRRRSLLTRFTLGLALVTVGVLWSLRVAEVMTIGWGSILSAALLVIGLGALVGSVVGRARPLVLVGVGLLPIVVLSQVVSPWTDGRLAEVPGLSAADGERRGGGAMRQSPTSVDQIEPSYEMGFGSIRLDLRNLEFDGAAVATRIESGVGEVRVFVPEDVEVAVQAQSGIGQVVLFDQERSSGFGAERRSVHRPDDPAGVVDLDLSVGIGSVQVHLVSPPDRDGSDDLDATDSTTRAPVTSRSTARGGTEARDRSAAADDDGPGTPERTE